MTEADLCLVAANERCAYDFPWPESVFRDCIREGQGCWVSEVDGEIVGHAVVSMGAGEAHLLNVCIKRDCQGHGQGRALVRHLIEQARQDGARVLFLEVRPSNHVAARLYESLGFTEIGLRKNYYPAPVGHEDARVLVIDLERSATISDH